MSSQQNFRVAVMWAEDRIRGIARHPRISAQDRVHALQALASFIDDLVDALVDDVARQGMNPSPEERTWGIDKQER